MEFKHFLLTPLYNTHPIQKLNEKSAYFLWEFLTDSITSRFINWLTDAIKCKQSLWWFTNRNIPCVFLCIFSGTAEFIVKFVLLMFMAFGKDLTPVYRLNEAFKVNIIR